MKLLYITNGVSGSGGLERVLAIKTDYLIDVLGYEVHIMVLNTNETSFFYSFNKKIVFHSLNLSGNLIKFHFSYFKQVNRLIKKINPNIVTVCDDGLKGFVVPCVTKFKAIVYERHASIHLNTIASESKWKKVFLSSLMIFLAKKFQKFVVLTESNKLDWDAKNLIVIPNFYSFYPNKSAKLQNKKVIVVGSHSYNKGYDLLLHSWKKISKEFPDWSLEIYGKIDKDKTYLKLSKELKLEESVTFFNPVNNIEEKYLEASIFVLPSRSEGFGMVLLEAMACGLPCVSFDCPSGPADIIRDGEDGFLIPLLELQNFEDKIKLLMDDFSLRKKMGSKAKENVMRFSVENIMKKWDALYKNLVHEDSI